MAAESQLPKAIHTDCGGDIEYVSLSNSSKTLIRCMKCFEEWEEEVHRYPAQNITIKE